MKGRKVSDKYDRHKLKSKYARTYGLQQITNQFKIYKEIFTNAGLPYNHLSVLSHFKIPKGIGHNHYFHQRSIISKDYDIRTDLCYNLPPKLHWRIVFNWPSSPEIEFRLGSHCPSPAFHVTSSRSSDISWPESEAFVGCDKQFEFAKENDETQIKKKKPRPRFRFDSDRNHDFSEDEEECDSIVSIYCMENSKIISDASPSYSREEEQETGKENPYFSEQEENVPLNGNAYFSNSDEEDHCTSINSMETLPCTEGRIEEFQFQRSSTESLEVIQSHVVPSSSGTLGEKLWHGNANDMASYNEHQTVEQVMAKTTVEDTHHNNNKLVWKLRINTKTKSIISHVFDQVHFEGPPKLKLRKTQSDEFELLQNSRDNSDVLILKVSDDEYLDLLYKSN